MVKVLLLCLFFYISFQVSTNCNASAGANVLDVSEECDDLDKCTIDCSKFVQGCSKTSELGLDLNTDYSNKVFNFVCRNDYYNQRDSIQNGIMKYVRQRAAGFNFLFNELSQHLLFYQAQNFNDQPLKLETFGDPRLEHPLQGLYVFGRFFSLFGDLCKGKIDAKKVGREAAERRVLNMLKDFHKGKNVFKLRDGLTKSSLWSTREIMKKYYNRAKLTTIINGKTPDSEFLDQEYKYAEAKMLELIMQGKQICPCNLLTRFTNEFHESTMTKLRLDFYNLEGWKDSNECKMYNKAFYESLKLSQSICQKICKSSNVISIPSFQVYRDDKAKFKYCGLQNK